MPATSGAILRGALAVVVLREKSKGESDRWAFERGLVSMMPLRLELTDDELLEKVKARSPKEQVADPSP